MAEICHADGGRNASKTRTSKCGGVSQDLHFIYSKVKTTVHEKQSMNNCFEQVYQTKNISLGR